VKKLKLLWILATIGTMAVAWFFLFGWTSRSSIRQPISRLQYFKSPSLVAIHVDAPPAVFLIHNILGENEADFEKWLDPANVEIASLAVDGDSMNGRWANHLEKRDVLQFGVHGSPRGTTIPNYGKEIAMGIAQEDFPHGSFEMMTPDQFAKLSLGPATNDVKVWGWLRYGTWNHYSLRDRSPERVGGA
jgi:hypothetical protein